MNWLAWRQHRKQFMIFGILLAIYAALVVPTGLHYWHTYQHALLTCGNTDTCAQLNSELFNPDGFILENMFKVTNIVMLALPFLLGLFWGAPLIAKEYNEDTNKLVWTQSVSRRRWLTVKLTWVLIAAAIFAAIFAALSTWWWRTGNALYLTRFHGSDFGTQGIVPIGYTLFAVAVGIAMGAWFKRTLTAIAIALAVLVAVQVIVPQFIRPHYMTPKTYVAQLSLNSGSDGGPDSPPTPPNSGAAWVTSSSLVDEAGRNLDWTNPPTQCIVNNPQIPSGHSFSNTAAPTSSNSTPNAITSINGGPAVNINCLISLKYQWHVKYQPSYRYWDFQRIETGLYLALSVIPLAGTYWLVLRRDA